MALTNVGVNLIASGVIGAGITAFNNANSYMRVGTSGNTFAATATGLISNTWAWKAMDATFPSMPSGNVVSWRSTFATTDANFAWEEWGVFNASGGGTMLNRKAETLGTKTSAQSWQIQVDIAFNNP